MRKKVELMSEKKPAVVADAPAAEKATRRAAKADKAATPTTKTGKTAHRGRPPLSFNFGIFLSLSLTD